MPETPDFEQIALLLERDGWQDGQEGARVQVVGALRQVWNARAACGASQPGQPRPTPRD